MLKPSVANQGYNLESVSRAPINFHHFTRKEDMSEHAWGSDGAVEGEGSVKQG